MPDSTSRAGSPAAAPDASAAGGQAASPAGLFPSSSAATESPLRILHVLAPARTGGLESVVIQLAGGMHRQGHDVHVALVLERGTDVLAHPVVQALKTEGVPLHVLEHGVREYRAERRAVRALLRKLNTQVLHTHGFRPDVLHGGMARRMKVAHVMTLHGFAGGSGRVRFYERLQVWAAGRASAVVVVSEPIAARLAAKGIRSNVHLVRNAVAPVANALSRAQAREFLKLPADVPLVGWVGRLSEEKGPDVFVRALASMGKGGAKAGLGLADDAAGDATGSAAQAQAADLPHGVIVGDGPMLTEVKALAEGLAGESSSGRLHCVGLVPGASRYLAAFDVLALSSHTEGTPMVLLEAMWARVPIVATAVGGVPDILSSAESVLVPVGASEALALAIEGLLADPARAAQLANAAFERVGREHSPSVWLERHAGIYRGCLTAMNQV